MTNFVNTKNIIIIKKSNYPPIIIKNETEFTSVSFFILSSFAGLFFQEKSKPVVRVERKSSLGPTPKNKKIRVNSYFSILMVRVERIELSSQVWKTCILTTVLYPHIFIMYL